MTNDLLQIKLRQRLNKLSSNDFDNLECWQIIEAFNKAALQWCRRQLHGMNQYKEGDEGSQRRHANKRLEKNRVQIFPLLSLWCSR